MTKFGKTIFTIVVLALALFGIFRWLNRAPSESQETSRTARGSSESSEAGKGLESFEFLVAGPAPKLPSPQTHQLQDNTVVINLSEYAGYAGIIAANKGLEPNPDSWFTRNGGFNVKITLSEEDTWGELQEGRFAATATTADVLANYGRQWQVTVPMQIAWSRGADGIIVRNEIRRINDLKGKRVATAAFSEAEFFIRYLAQEAGLAVHRLDDVNATPRADGVNLVFLEDAFTAGDAFLADLQSDQNLLAGCVTWAPKTTAIVDASKGKARQLVDNRNLLIIADILLFNKGFAEANPQIVQTLVEGTLIHNEQVRSNPDDHLDILVQAFAQFEWTREDAKSELSKVHLSNLPENLSFFRGPIDAAGSFASVYESANLAYGSALLPNPVASSYFTNLSALEAIDAEGTLASQVASLQPIRSSGREPLENDPLLTRDIRFFFLPNDHRLDLEQEQNTQFLTDVSRLLGVSPGSMILLRGHVDNARVEEFRAQGGETLLRNMALQAKELSNKRASEVRDQLLLRYPAIDPDRLQTVGLGWEEPAGPDSDLNRRVEVQWFTLE